MLFWLVTIIGSYIMNFKMAFMMLKDLADAGYKLNVDNIKRFSEEVNENNTNNKLIYLIPVINMLYSFKIAIDYNNSRWNILDQLRILNVLDTMSIEEKRKYKENPTALNALMLLIEKTEIKLDKDNKEINEIQKVIEKDIKEIEKDFDNLLKTVCEENNWDYEVLKERVKPIINDEKENNLSVVEIKNEKDFLNNYKKEIENSLNSKEKIKTLKKVPEENNKE